MLEPLALGGSLRCQDVLAVAEGRSVVLEPAVAARMTAGFEGASADGGSEILRSKWAWLGGGPPPPASESAARRFLLDHCAGFGPPLPPDVVRAALLVRAQTLAAGHSGCRPVVVEALLRLLEHDIIPVVPAGADVGAAGSPALAHIARVACGFGGEAWRKGVRLPAAEAMAGLPPLVPTEREALALINGASLAVADGALTLARAERVLAALDAAATLSFEVVRAQVDCLAEPLLAARRCRGALAVGAGLRRRLAGSTLVGRDRSPDSFSVRATPVVHGAAWDVWDQSRRTLEDELAAVMDNPLWFPEVGTLEGGNFHGAPTALALDSLKVGLTTIAGIAERRVFRVTYGQLSGLPSFLVPDSGLHSGLMLAQYTAASLVSEAKGLSHPAAVDTVPTVQHQEDHVSMAAGAAASARQVLDLVADVAAIELLCGAQGLDLRLARGEGRPGLGTARIRDRVRSVVATWEVDRPLHPDLAALGALVRQGAFLEEQR